MKLYLTLLNILVLMGDGKGLHIKDCGIGQLI